MDKIIIIIIIIIIIYNNLSFFLIVFDKSIERMYKITQKIQNTSTSQISMALLKGQDKKHRHFMKFGINNNNNNDLSKLNNSFTRKTKDESMLSINKSATSENLASIADITGEKFYPADVNNIYLMSNSKIL